MFNTQVTGGQRWAGLALTAVLLGGCSEPGLVVEPMPTVQLGELPNAVARPYAVLVAPGSNLSERSAAAEVLLGSSDPVAMRALGSSLNEGQPEGAWQAVLQSIAAMPEPPEAMIGPVLAMRPRVPDELDESWAAAVGRYEQLEPVTLRLSELANDPAAPVDQRRLAIDALGQTRTQASAGALVELLDPLQPELVQQSATEALVALSGRPDLGDDAERWRAWWEQNRRLDERRWERRLRQNLASRPVADDAGRDRLVDRLLQSQRALYGATSPQDRAAVLAYMLDDPLVPIRQLGMDLSVQRSLDDQPFDASLRGSLRERLTDESSALRRQAALLLRDIGDGGGADAAASRLAEGSETVPAVQRSLLLLLERSPRAEAVDPALEMLDSGDVRVEAAEFLAAAGRQQLLDDRQRQSAVRRVRGLMEQGDLRPALVRLLGQTLPAGDEQWEQLRQWLESPDADLRRAAGLAWAGSDQPLLPLAARIEDGTLRPVILQAAAARGDEPAVLELLVGARPQEAAGDAAWRRALVEMSGRVPPGWAYEQVLRISANERNAPLRESMLTAALERAGDGPGRWAMLLERAEAWLTLGRPGEALDDLQALEPAAGQLLDQQRDRMLRARVRAHLRLEQTDRAFAAARLLLAGPDGRVPAAAAGDPVIDRFVQTASVYVQRGQSAQAARVLDGLRLLLGPRIAPELARRIGALDEQMQGLGQ